MTLENKILQIKKWVSLVEEILKNISLFFEKDDYSKLEEDTVAGLELKIENILQIYQQESVDLEFISYIYTWDKISFDGHDDNKDLEITFSQGSDCKEKKTTCFYEILNKINNNIDELLDLKTLDEFINYAEEKKTEQRYQRMSKETIQKRLASFKILNKFIIEILLTIFHIELCKEMPIDSTNYDHKYTEIREFFREKKSKYLQFFDNHKSYIEDLLTNYEEFSLHKKEMAEEKLYKELKCTEEFTVYVTTPVVKISSETPERKPLKRRRTTAFEERRTTPSEDIKTEHTTNTFSCLWFVGEQCNDWQKHKKRSKDRSKDRSNSAPPKFSYTIDIKPRPPSISSDEYLTKLFNQDWSQETEVWDEKQTPQIAGH